MIDVFDDVFELPDPDKSRQFDELVGLDEVKEQLVKEGRLLLNPKLLDEWSIKHHGIVLPAVAKFHERPPLIMFSGDVGTGKTTLANSFGDVIARGERIAVRVLRLSLLTRGKGAVGEMTKLITRAFEEVQKLAREANKSHGRPTSAVILVIDEADAIAQSRDFDQMHHEDRAGVNALIRGIDLLTHARLPVIVVMCTNRHEAIDPGILRRAAAHFTFERPNTEQREYVLRTAFDSVFKGDEIQKLAELTGSNHDRNYGYTYSDLTQRLIPTVLLKAFPDNPITFDLAVSLAEKIEPTKPFNTNRPT
ncbi:MAG: AAA family ATPase [Nitrospinae bacterium]|nr:AAA family ATPase [Nitrospinota bacterium]